MIRIFSPFNSLLILAVIIALILGLSNVALEQEIAVHWNALGQPDGFMPAKFALWIGPIGCVATILVLSVYNARANPDEQLAGRALAGASATIAFAVMCFVQITIVMQAMGQALDIARLATIFIGFALMFVGNYLPKSQRNNFSGIRTPWALASDENWTRTHQFGGIIFMLGGAITLLMGLLNGAAPFSLIIALVCVIVSALASIIYSYAIRD